MTGTNHFEVIIIGGSYAGLSAGLSLGRALRKVLIIDSGKPCNRQTPYSHNFLTQDGKSPREISATGRSQVEQYKTVKFHEGIAITGTKTETGFELETLLGERFIAKKLIFATGVKDTMPDMQGFSECWGISVIHCPYCHGYEYRDNKTGILANGEIAFELGKLIENWTKELTIFTNGESMLTEEQYFTLSKHEIKVNEKEIDHFEHNNGQIENIVFKDGTLSSVRALYARPSFEQHCDIPKQLGCEFTEMNYIKVDGFQKTTIHGISACGDNASMMRSVSSAVATGALSGALTNRELIEDAF